jgi:hypothetical protein
MDEDIPQAENAVSAPFINFSPFQNRHNTTSQEIQNSTAWVSLTVTCEFIFQS